MPSPEPPAPLGPLLRAASLAFDAAVIARVRALGGPHRDLKATDLGLLSSLDEDGTRIGVLARRNQLTTQAISQLVDGLQAAGWVERRPDPDDARARLVAWTPEGLDRMAVAKPLVVGLQQELTEAVGSDALAHVRRALATLTAHLQRA